MENLELLRLRKKLGAVYTPSTLADWTASLLMPHLEDGASVLDPACGDGALLNPFFGKVKNQLLGVDVNSSELEKATMRMGRQLNSFVLDSLVPSNDESASAFWTNFFLKHKIRAVISNPPWGAQIAHNREVLLNNGMSLARGQFDSYALFIELMVSAAPIGTHFVFIIPDSFFSPESKALREFLLNHCEMGLIARLGEGFFPGIYRGVVVLQLRKSKPNIGHEVECFRIDRVTRQKILKGDSSLGDARIQLAHKIPQLRFQQSPERLFDIDVSTSDRTIDKVEKIEKVSLGELFLSGRGVELSKSGRVIICKGCATWRPLPKKDFFNCKRCGETLVVGDAQKKTIISHSPGENAWPLIVGEDVERYRANPSRFITKGIEGINYKEESEFKRPKLVFRKTGVGINAAIDYSGSYTNQVVFHYSTRPHSKTPEFMLEFALGVISSRLMTAYYLKKYGDNEWRSHPYITQKIINQLPIPRICKGSKSWRLAKEIAELSRKLSATHCGDEFLRLDLTLERRVLDLYGMNKDDAKFILRTLRDAQQLIPIRRLVVEIDLLAPSNT